MRLDADAALHSRQADLGANARGQPRVGRGLGGPADLARWERDGHLGLVGMRERLGALGGTVRLTDAPGGGTELHARLPAATASVSAPGAAA